MGLWNKLFGGADGIREAMRDTYLKHYTRAKQSPQGDGSSPHFVGLYQALGSRYMVTRKPTNEFLLYAELTPFHAMEEEDAVDMLIEYIVYQERPQDARVGDLRKRLNAAVRDLLCGRKVPKPYADMEGGADVGIKGSLAMAVGNGVQWIRLLDEGTGKLLAGEVEKIVAKLGSR